MTDGKERPPSAGRPLCLTPLVIRRPLHGAREVLRDDERWREAFILPSSAALRPACRCQARDETSWRLKESIQVKGTEVVFLTTSKERRNTSDLFQTPSSEISPLSPLSSLQGFVFMPF
ncbi:hypothetical protein EYF80_060640 [Liparis tanakae]|uniref:Uncharacterized protein n=1 Tax=Liparis tanakae TaxID=230148 RepID=A0A4Z2ELH4_9TELE|nr:hypothetical protein EYF80_060640 [Liparis tanakae]